MEVRHVGLDIHDARDSLPDFDTSSCIPLPHFKYGFGPCVRYIKVVYSSRKQQQCLHCLKAEGQGCVYFVDSIRMSAGRINDEITAN